MLYAYVYKRYEEATGTTDFLNPIAILCKNCLHLRTVVNKVNKVYR